MYQGMACSATAVTLWPVPTCMAGWPASQHPQEYPGPLGSAHNTLSVFVCWSLTSLCHSNGHIETIPAREINPFTALTRIRSQLLRTQWSTSNHSEWTQLRVRPLSHRGWPPCQCGKLLWGHFHWLVMTWLWPAIRVLLYLSSNCQYKRQQKGQ